MTCITSEHSHKSEGSNFDFISQRVEFKEGLPNVVILSEVFPKFSEFLSNRFPIIFDIISILLDESFTTDLSTYDEELFSDIKGNVMPNLKRCMQRVDIPDANFGSSDSCINQQLINLEESLNKINNILLNILNATPDSDSITLNNLSSEIDQLRTQQSGSSIFRKSNLEAINFSGRTFPGFTTPEGEKRILVRIERNVGADIDPFDSWTECLLTLDSNLEKNSRSLVYKVIDLEINSSRVIKNEILFKLDLEADSTNKYTFMDPSQLYEMLLPCPEVNGESLGNRCEVLNNDLVFLIKNKGINDFLGQAEDAIREVFELLDESVLNYEKSKTLRESSIIDLKRIEINDYRKIFESDLMASTSLSDEQEEWIDDITCDMLQLLGVLDDFIEGSAPEIDQVSSLVTTQTQLPLINNCWLNTIFTAMCSDGPVKDLYRDRVSSAIEAIDFLQCMDLSTESLSDNNTYDYDRSFLQDFLSFQSSTSNDPFYKEFRTKLLSKYLRATPTTDQEYEEYDSSEMESYILTMVRTYIERKNIIEEISPIGSVQGYYRLKEGVYKPTGQSYYYDSLTELTINPEGAETIIGCLTKEIANKGVVIIEGLPNVMTVKESFSGFNDFLSKNFPDLTVAMGSFNNGTFFEDLLVETGHFKLENIIEKIIFLDKCISMLKPSNRFGASDSSENILLESLKVIFINIENLLKRCLDDEINEGLDEHLVLDFNKGLNGQFLAYQEKINSLLFSRVISRDAKLERIVVDEANEFLGITGPNGEIRVLTRVEIHVGSGTGSGGHWVGVVLKKNENDVLEYVYVDINNKIESVESLDNVRAFAYKARTQNVYTFFDPELI
jgi:hypothetical protein